MLFVKYDMACIQKKIIPLTPQNHEYYQILNIWIITHY